MYVRILEVKVFQLIKLEVLALNYFNDPTQHAKILQTGSFKQNKDIFTNPASAFYQTNLTRPSTMNNVKSENRSTYKIMQNMNLYSY